LTHAADESRLRRGHERWCWDSSTFGLRAEPATRATSATTSYPAFGALPLVAIERPDVQQWVRMLSEEKGLAPKTVRECHRIMSMIMREAVDSKRLAASPCNRITLPRLEHKEKRFLTAVEVDVLAEAMDERSSPRSLEPTSRARPRASGSIPAPNGGMLHYSGFRGRFWNPAVEHASLGPLTPHELRLTFVALSIAQGADSLTIQRRLGHKDIRTTLNVYGHLFPDRDVILTERMDAAYRDARRERLAAYPRPEAENGVVHLPATRAEKGF
jgi:hypothetical protein